MSNPSKRKGTDAETAVVNYLRAQGFPATERRTLQGSNDKGDINLPFPEGLVIEVKAERTISLAVYMDETEAEKANAYANIGVCWHKRRGRSSPAEWYVTMTGDQFVEILARLADAEDR